MTSGLRLAIGKRAGVASGLLGMLCVLGELCFLFPDLLVTPDALPMYKQHLGLFRAMLEGSILLTFVLGAAGLVLARPNRHGLAGLLLGATALLMGGSKAEAIDIASPRAFSVGLDYFVLELLALGLVFIPLEGIFALRPMRVFREGWQTDFKHFFVSHAGVQVFSFATLIPVQVALGWTTRFAFREVVASQPLWLQFLE
ncbi:MAG: sterol desaturase family protein, partial [Thermoanaerobaculia bacterium]